MKILLLEDEAKIAHILKNALADQNYKVEHSENISDADYMIGIEKYDLLLFDRMLPDGDSIDLLKKIRANGIDTPVIMLTAMGSLDNKVEGLNLGADDYLPKPFAFKELLARIKALHRRHNNNSSNIIIIDIFELNIDQKIFKAADTIIELSNKEFLILQELMSNPNRIYSKQDLINNIWPDDKDVLDNTVEVFISNIRKKLNEYDTNKLIQTVRGVGYRCPK